MNIEDKYLNERVFGLDTDSLSRQANQSLKNLEKAIKTNSPDLSRIAASTLQTIFYEGYEQGKKVNNG
jgi:hypothetical protein